MEFQVVAVDPSPGFSATGHFHDCLNRLKDRLADPTSGSDLGRLLRTGSGFPQEDPVLGQRAGSSQTIINAARLAVAALWLFIAGLGFHANSARRSHVRVIIRKDCHASGEVCHFVASVAGLPWLRVQASPTAMEAEGEMP
jgi:hypothetical protein